MAEQPRVSDDDRVITNTENGTPKQVTKYSMRVLVEAANPNNMGRMVDADAYGIIQGCCGDTMEIYLRLDAETIVEATFMTDGRESAVACGNMLTKMVKGRFLTAAGQIKPEELISALGGLPPAKTHCATLTVNTLAKAIANLREKE